ncbi:hypothetical protein ACA910_008834 [Epithemia clementina (nom. ined.)]
MIFTNKKSTALFTFAFLTFIVLLGMVNSNDECDIVSVVDKDDTDLCPPGLQQKIEAHLSKINECIYQQELGNRRDRHLKGRVASTMDHEDHQRQLQAPCYMCDAINTYWFCRSLCRGYRRRAVEEEGILGDMMMKDQQDVVETAPSRGLVLGPLDHHVAPKNFHWNELFGLTIVDNSKCIPPLSQNPALRKCLENAVTAASDACLN